jgi:hypothetical protein
MFRFFPLGVPTRLVPCRLTLALLAPALILAFAPTALAQTPPPLPTFGTNTYNVTVFNPNVDGGATAVGGTGSTNAATNTAVINDYINYCSQNGGGTVDIPAGQTFVANELLLNNNVDLQVDGTLLNGTSTATFISTAANATINIGISGSGVINNAATTTSDNKMIYIPGVTNVAVTGVTIENAPNEHLCPECCNNVTINGVTINDPLGFQSDTDGIDFSGNNFLIENCNIADGDDDIVAKADGNVQNGITAATSNIVIENDTITAGHGISIGGTTTTGVNGMYVANCTLSTGGSGTIEDAIHLKAGDGSTSTYQNGGTVQNITFNGITIKNVDDGLVIDSFYNADGSNYPPTPSASAPFPAAPTDATEPLWKNITFENINITGISANAANIYGLNSSPPNTDGLNFKNISITSAGHPWDMYYADDVYMNGVTVNGVTIPDSLDNAENSSGSLESQEYADTFDASANPIYNPTPEPASCWLLAVTALYPLSRRLRPRRF